jgi:hypothetical protein
MAQRRSGDPLRVTAQPALTTSTGRRWLIWGAVLAAVSVGVLVALALARNPAGWVAVAIVIALYLAMVVVRVVVAATRARLIVLACLMGAIAIVALVSIVVVGALSA